MIGCFLKGYICDGWIPFTWMIGQVVIGVICACVFSRTDRKLLRIIAVILSVFLGIAIISSGISAIIFHLPIGLKIFKGSIGAATDSLAMIVGLYLVDVIGKLEMKVVK